MYSYILSVNQITGKTRQAWEGPQPPAMSAPDTETNTHTNYEANDVGFAWGMFGMVWV